MNLAATQAAEKKLLVQTYDRHAVMFVSGEGVHLRDADGNEYLDLLSGIGVSALGYNHPAITKTITEQAATLLHTSNLFYHSGTATLATKLTEITGMDRVFFCNSGTEAWEAALKIARSHATLLRNEGKQIGTKILALEHSFHGRTMGAVATTHKAKYREPFGPLTPGVEFVPFNDVAALRAAFSNDVCAIAIEVLQGEGGIHPVSQEFFAAARELCDSTGALLLCDEIQSGIGRTGKWCAYQHYGIQPDVTTLAKALAGGLPMGATLCTEEAARAITPGMHGTTFGGGPLVCAVALTAIDTIEHENLLAHNTEVGNYFMEKLRALKKKHDCIVEVRGMGLMIGMELNDDDVAGKMVTAMLEHHVIINRTSETVLRFLPPYLITKADVDEGVAALDSALTEVLQAHTVLAGDHTHGE
ncbi:MAG: acetylornithine transaminase [Acidobacteria bacterium]|nr:acetylornithine transaminase [Acidobacteriota bacterium]